MNYELNSAKGVALLKKFFSLFFCVLIAVSAAGCTKKSSDVTAVTTGLSFTAEISCHNTELICDAVISTSGDAQFTIVSPEEIKDMKFSFSEGGTVISFHGIEYKTEGDLTQTDILSAIYNILKTADKNTVILEDDTFKISGTAACGDYTVELGESGLPLKIICDDRRLEVTIKNASII